MGCKPQEVKVMTLKDFKRMRLGYKFRRDEEWDMVATILADIRSTAFGSKKSYTRKQVMPIKSIDNVYTEKIKQIKTAEEALNLLKTF